MTHLFKLKKDGKTAGYCEWTEDWGWKYYNELEPESKFTHFMVAQTGLTAHPFVTKDKNGKDVFAGNKVKWKQPDEIAAETYGEYEEAEAVTKGGFLFWDVDGSTFCPADEIGDIELIEEKKQ